MRLLLVEDEPTLNKTLSKRLKSEGYAVDSCLDGLEAIDFLDVEDYDAIILDIMLPGLDGMSLIKRLRLGGKMTPVLFLTAKDSIEDRVQGLNAGANDYLIKPFATEELLARIRVLLRQAVVHATDIFYFADLEVDCTCRIVRRAGKEIALSGKEFSILEYLIRNQGVVLSKAAIERRIWDFDFEGDDNIVKVYIRYLRKKIDDPFERKLIHTVRNFGYVLREAKTDEDEYKA